MTKPPCSGCERNAKLQYVNCLCQFHEEGIEPFFCSSGVRTQRGVSKDTPCTGHSRSSYSSSEAVKSSGRLLLLT